MMNQIIETYVNESELLEGYIYKSEKIWMNKFDNLIFIEIYLLFDIFVDACVN